MVIIIKICEGKEGGGKSEDLKLALAECCRAMLRAGNTVEFILHYDYYYQNL
jgi:hypothetical protein